MDTKVVETQGLDGSVEWVKNVIFARLSPDIFEAAIVEYLGYDMEFGSALLEDFGIDDAFNSGFDVVRRLRVEANSDSCKILVAVDGVGISRALGLVCPRFRRDIGSM